MIKKIIKYCILFIVCNFIIVGYYKNNTVNTIVVDNNKEIEPGIIKISYVGDLILLKDQVIASKKNNKYDFDYMFKYTKDYLSDSDYSIGVFEGPMAGGNTFSTSNYGDGNKLYLNFPDSFAESVKDSGIDFVTTANNHMLDKGYSGAMRTIKKLDEVGLEHVGTYSNEEDYSFLKIINIQGVKIAVLAYSYGSNYKSKSYFYETKPYLTRILVDKGNAYYEKSLEIVTNDMEMARNSDADLILIMAHMGTQFSHVTSDFQDTWNETFSSLGANIILGDHSHTTQPIEYVGDTLVVNCPGNFANSYIKHDGDATAIVNIYIDKVTKKIDSTSIIPMYTQEYEDNKFRAVPIYNIFTDEELKKSFKEKDLRRSKKVLNIVTESMIGKKIEIEGLQQEYFYNVDEEITFDEELENSKFYDILSKSDTIAFFGDSITEGTKNGYHPWYEPLEEYLIDKNIINNSKGAISLKKFYETRKDSISETIADVFVIALGTNDIRYRCENCSLTTNEYIKYMKKLTNTVLTNNKDAKIIILVPWMSLDYDIYSKINLKEKNELFEEYTSALVNEYYYNEDVIVVNQNIYLKEFFSKHIASDYLVDFIHPNSKDGLDLYTKAVLASY